MYTISQLQTKIEMLDTYTKAAVYGAWHYAVLSAAINAAMRSLPKEPEERTIDTFNDFVLEQQQTTQRAVERCVPGLMHLADDIATWINDNGGTPRTISETLDFMRGRNPTADQFKNEFEQRRRMGMKPSIPLAQFVEMELSLALRKHAEFVARGGDAVRLCETCAIMAAREVDEESVNDTHTLPDWVLSTFEEKLISKLHARWTKLELQRTNWRAPQQARDDAAADQMLIQSLMIELGESPRVEEDEAAPVVQAPTPVATTPVEPVTKPKVRRVKKQEAAV